MTPADLRAACDKLGLTQHGLARKLRMGKNGQQTVSNWMSDKNERGVPGPVQVAVEYMLKEAADWKPEGFIVPPGMEEGE